MARNSETVAAAIEAVNTIISEQNAALKALKDTLSQKAAGGSGSSGIYMAKITPEEDLNGLTITHNLATTDILMVAAWAETLGDIELTTNNSLAKFWAKTDIVTRRGGNGFSPGYSWSSTNSYADASAPNTAAYENLTINDENTIYLPRTSSGTKNYYLAGLTYTVIVIAANAEV